MKDEIKEKLIIILKLFKDKPQFLIKFLLENNAFTENFLLSIYESQELDKLKNLEDNDEVEEDIFSNIPHFKDILSMNNYFKKIVSNEELIEEDNIYEKINRDLEQRMIDQLKEAIEEERYEDASILRDRMKELNINFKKFF